MLKQIQISGFKSFARKTQIDLDSPVVAIVGPNGSGKSNIVEAVRFALGEQSYKSIRSSGKLDLLWHGSKLIPKTNRASVTLVFDNSNKTFDFDYKQLKIQRVIYADGSSEYFVNESKVRLKDVLYILSTGNVGANKHIIISQGETDKIVLADPKQRLEILKDALGLRGFYQKKQDTDTRIEKTLQHIDKIKLAQAELRPRLEFLKRQVEKAKKLETLKKELLENLKKFVQAQQIQIAKLQNQLPDKDALKEKISQTKNKISQLQQQLHNAKQNSKSQSTDTLKQAEQIQSQINQLQQELAQSYALLGELKAKSNTNSSQIDTKFISSVLKNLTTEAKSALNSHDIVRIRGALEHIVSELQALAERLSTPENLRTPKQILDQIKQVQQKIAQTTNKINLLQEEKQNILNQQTANTQEINRISLEIASLQLELEKLQHLFQQAQQQQNQLRQLQEQIQSQIKESLVLAPEYSLEIRKIAQQSYATPEKETENVYQISKKLERVKLQIEQLGKIDDAILEEYEQVNSRYEFYQSELEDLEKTIQKLQKLSSQIKQELEEKLQKDLQIVNQKFSEFLNTLFLGGSGRVKIINKPPQNAQSLVGTDNKQEVVQQEQDEFSLYGAEIDLSLPKKKIKSLSMLSGGERSLVSIALVFALSQVSPPPFLILDETDAALDEVNARRYANMLKVLSNQTQLIVITHNRETMLSADTLIGVVMDKEGASKILKVSFKEAEEMVESR